MRTEAQPYRPDLFQYYGTVYARRMFGGLGLFSGDAMVGIVIDDLIYLKTDENTRQDYIAEGAGPFVYRKRTGEGVSMSYYELPERLYDEPEEFAEWVRRAYAVAENSPSVRRKRSVVKPARKKPARA